jgi:hypothetical protein
VIFEFLNDFIEPEVFDEIIDWDVNRGDTNTLEGVVILLNVIKSFIVFD